MVVVAARSRPQMMAFEALGTPTLAVGVPSVPPMVEAVVELTLGKRVVGAQAAAGPLPVMVEVPLGYVAALRLGRVLLHEAPPHLALSDVVTVVILDSSRQALRTEQWHLPCPDGLPRSSAPPRPTAVGWVGIGLSL